MAGTQKSVRWEPWIERAIWDIAREIGKNFSWTANYLVETKLNDMKRYRQDYEPDTQGVDRKDKADNQKEDIGKTAM